MHFCLSSTLKNRHKTGAKASVCDVLHEKVYKTPVLPVHIVNEAFWKRCVFKRLLKAFLCLLYRQPVALFSELISAQWAQRRLITRFILENAMALMDVTKRGVPSYNFFCCKDHSYWLKQVLFYALWGILKISNSGNVTDQERRTVEEHLTFKWFWFHCNSALNITEALVYFEVNSSGSYERFSDTTCKAITVTILVRLF